MAQSHWFKQYLLDQPNTCTIRVQYLSQASEVIVSVIFKVFQWFRYQQTHLNHFSNLLLSSLLL